MFICLVQFEQRPTYLYLLFQISSPPEPLQMPGGSSDLKSSQLISGQSAQGTCTILYTQHPS